MEEEEEEDAEAEEEDEEEEEEDEASGLLQGRARSARVCRVLRDFERLWCVLRVYLWCLQGFWGFRAGITPTISLLNLLKGLRGLLL